MNLFENTYLINVDKYPERLEAVTKELNSIGISFNRVSGIPGDSVPRNIKNIEEGSGWNYNAAGLSLTTIGIIKEAIDKKLEYIFIFEDDVSVNFSFKEGLERFIKEVPDDWDFIHLNMFHLRPPKRVSKNVRRVVSATSCQAYAVKRKAYKGYLKKLETMSKPIDEHTKDLQKELKCYCPVNDLFYHKPGRYSTILEKKVNY